MNISYKIRTSRRAKRLRISVSHGGVMVTKPRWASLVAVMRRLLGLRTVVAENFVQEKIGWILKKLALFANKPIRETIRGNYLEDKERALEFVEQRLNHFNKFYNFKVGKISIKNHKTLWGSCSKKGNLNFNCRLVNLAPGLADYIIVHELCHLKELNHSRNFWDLVEGVIPNHKDIRRELKKIKIF